MSPSSRFATGGVLVTANIRASILRYHEFPPDADDCDRQAFVRWLFSVLPTIDQRYQEGPVELFVTELPLYVP